MVSHIVEPSHNSVWLVDSGCTSHMTLVVAYFSLLDNSFETSVKMGNGATVQVHGKGSISVNTPKAKIMFTNVYLKLDVVCEHVYRAKDNVSSLWHRRMSHFNLRTLNYMQLNDFLSDLPKLNISDDKCDSCQLGKSHRLPFSLDGVKRANMKLELVHSDLCGPMKTSSMNANMYFVLFIDDLTRMCWVYFLKSKLNVSDEFNDFCRDSGILHQLTVSRTPQQYRVCERRNRIILEMAICMLFEKHLPKLFWAEAVATTVYLLNMLATKAVNGKHFLKIGLGLSHIILWNWERNDVKKHDLMLISEELVITEDAKNGETSDWFDVVGTTDADESEISTIEKNGTWFLTDLPSGKPIGVKWVYRAKFNPDGTIFKHKARLVVKGYAQIGGVDYGDTFAPVARLDTIRLLIAIAGQLGKEHQVHKLKRALYGLKKHRELGSNDKTVSEFKLSMQKEFEMSDLGLMSYFLGMKINQSNAGIFISKNKYVKSTLVEGLNYLKMDNVVLIGYSDSDWTRSLDDMKSTSGYVFNLGSGVICWNSKKQQVVAQSTVEVEYIVAVAAANQAIWLRNLLSDLVFKQESATVILFDKKSAIATENPVQHGRTKHINVKFHAILNAEKNSLIKMKFCSSEI
ncbi:hypothetical protein GQ457_03G022420 [Hibiscus cannabinus]